MAKFTKLNIGEAVASSGGRVWKKLSAESEVVEDELAGTWVFNDVLNFDEAYSVTLDFTTDGRDCTKLWSFGDVGDQPFPNTLRYGIVNTENTVPTFCYMYGEWIDTAYKTIEISTLYADIIVNDGNADALAFLTWLKANATKIA